LWKRLGERDAGRGRIDASLALDAQGRAPLPGLLDCRLPLRPPPVEGRDSIADARAAGAHQVEGFLGRELQKALCGRGFAEAAEIRHADQLRQSGRRLQIETEKTALSRRLS